MVKDLHCRKSLTLFLSKLCKNVERCFLYCIGMYICFCFIFGYYYFKYLILSSAFYIITVLLSLSISSSKLIIGAYLDKFYLFV